MNPIILHLFKKVVKPQTEIKPPVSPVPKHKYHEQDFTDFFSNVHPQICVEKAKSFFKEVLKLGGDIKKERKLTDHDFNSAWRVKYKNKSQFNQIMALNGHEFLNDSSFKVSTYGYPDSILYVARPVIRKNKNVLPQ